MRPFDVTQPDSRFEALAESSPDAILTIDADSTILSANAAVERIFGYTPEELVGRSLLVLIPERLRAAHEQGVARYLRTGVRHLTWTGNQLPALTKDGHEIPTEISFGEFVDESGRHIFSGFVRDISERVRQREELEEARAAAERALRDLARLGRITDVAIAQATYGDMLRELLRRLREELTADEASVLLMTAHGDLAAYASDGLESEVEQHVRIAVGQGISGRVVATGKPAVVEDLATVEVASAPVREQVTSLAAVPIRSGNDIIGVLHVGTRVRRLFTPDEVHLLEVVAERMAGALARTRSFEGERRARKEAEAARHALAQHEAELRRLNAELEVRSREAEAAVRSRDEVLSVVSHDLRNPVSTVMMSASLLQDPTIPLGEEDRRKQLEVITRSAQRMNRLIQDLLDVARLEGGRFALNCRCEDPGALAAEACEAFRPIAARQSVTLACHIEPGLRPTLMDRDRVLQAISNYLNNAVKFTRPPGHITLRAAPADDGGVCFAVSDTGPGIPAEEMPHLFTRFWQARGTRHLGSGLGLAIAKGIAEAHQGRAWAESTPGEGSTFYLAIPGSAGCG